MIVSNRAIRAGMAATMLALATPVAVAQPSVMLGWVPKKTPVESYSAPNRAWWKLADVLAMHRREATWTQPIVRNKDLAADWKQLATGSRTPATMYADSRTGLIVWRGQVRVTMDGQAPFVASKGFEIDVPFRVPFTLETVGDQPALWFEVRAADAVPLYPAGSTPERPKDIPGFTYVQTAMSGGGGGWDETNRTFLDYYRDVVGGSAKATAFVASDHMFINNIRGKGVPTPPASNRGHFHVGYSEFWFVMEGNIDYQIEGVPFFTAAAGDVVTAAQGRWHRASFGGPTGQMGTRVAINPFPRGLHNYAPESGGRQ